VLAHSDDPNSRVQRISRSSYRPMGSSSRCLLITQTTLGQRDRIITRAILLALRDLIKVGHYPRSRCSRFRRAHLTALPASARASPPPSVASEDDAIATR